MRYSIYVSEDMMFSLVMALIALNRDQEAYNIIKFWAIQLFQTNHDDLVKMFNELKPGELLNFPNQNFRENIHKNICEMDSKLQREVIPDLFWNTLGKVKLEIKSFPVGSFINHIDMAGGFAKCPYYYITLI